MRSHVNARALAIPLRPSQTGEIDMSPGDFIPGVAGREGRHGVPEPGGRRVAVSSRPRDAAERLLRPAHRHREVRRARNLESLDGEGLGTIQPAFETVGLREKGREPALEGQALELLGGLFIEAGQPAKRCVVFAVRTGKAYPHRRRLSRGSVVDANMNGVQRRTHWYFAPA